MVAGVVDEDAAAAAVALPPPCASDSTQLCYMFFIFCLVS